VGPFKAIVISEKGAQAALADFDEANLMDVDVTVRVEYSTVNYKGGLAITGKAPVVRRFPMIAGIEGAVPLSKFCLSPTCYPTETMAVLALEVGPPALAQPG